MIYDLSYYENMLRMYSKTAEEINKIRWKWIEELKPLNVLDYGSGVGWFRAWRPENVQVDSFDIGAYPTTGLRFNFYDIVCFWDVLEHFVILTELLPIFNKAHFIAGTIPILPLDKPLKLWHHHKPNEHMHHRPKCDWLATFAYLGWKVKKEGTPECPPRLDIWSFILERNNHEQPI
jgi:hypothetical protein